MTGNARASVELMKVHEFRGISSDHIRRAVELLLEGSVEHGFGRSTHYDVVTSDGSHFPPKAVFGLAAKLALGLELRPGQFKGGERTPCFRAIRAAGFLIEPKGSQQPILLNDSDHDWTEGHRMRVAHLRLERSRTAVRKKRRAFREENGHLQCEQCGMVPSKVYGEENGDACIEVHHVVPLSSLGRRRKTRLKDLICVCANCPIESSTTGSAAGA